MPRMACLAAGDVPYHVINRANNRSAIFTSDKEYRHFESLLEEAVVLTDMRLLAYVLIPNHWHLLLYPKRDNDMGEFMRWLTTTHVRQHRTRTKNVGYGHLYQGRYKSFPIEEDYHLIDVIRYIEQNPLRAHLVERAEDWPFSSLYRRAKEKKKRTRFLAPLPTELPRNYLQSVNQLLNEDDLKTMRNSVNKEKPYGTIAWVDRMATSHHLEGTQRGSGRPRKKG